MPEQLPENLGLPVTNQRIRTDHGSEFGGDFTWHLHDLGIAYRRVTFRSSQDLARKLRAWEHEYNHRRPHLALAGRTPAERLCELRITAPKAWGNQLDYYIIDERS